MSKLYNVTHLDRVWDRYVETSLEGMAMEKRRKGVCRRVVADGGISEKFIELPSEQQNRTVQLLD